METSYDNTQKALLDSVHDAAVSAGRTMSKFNQRSHLAHDACHVIAFTDGLDLDSLEDISRSERQKYAEVWDEGGVAFDALWYVLVQFDYQKPRRRLKHINYWSWNKDTRELDPTYGFERF